MDDVPQKGKPVWGYGKFAHIPRVRFAHGVVIYGPAIQPEDDQGPEAGLQPATHFCSKPTTF